MYYEILLTIFTFDFNKIILMSIRFDTVLFHCGVWNLFTETDVLLVIYVVSSKIIPMEMLLDTGKKSDIEYTTIKRVKN